MKHILLLLFLCSVSFAQYNTPGTGVNWNLDSLVVNSGGIVTGGAGTYTVTNQIVIAPDDRVFIEPGTTVQFSGSSSGFRVFGKFYAAGTEADSIYFTSLTPDSTGAAYDGFRFDSSSVDTACRIEYAKIEYAYFAFKTLNSSPVFTNNYAYKCRRGGDLFGSDAVFTHNKIERCYEYGITMTVGSSPVVEYNEFVNNNTQNTGAKNQISIGTQNDNSPVVRYNKVHGGMFNKTGGISVSSLFTSGSSSNAEIAYNEVYNNSFGLVMTGYNITCYVHDNKIYNNNINPSVMTTGSGINIYGGDTTDAPVIAGNEIYGNWWGVTLQGACKPNLGNTENSDTTDDGKNIIYGNIQGANVYDLYNNTKKDIYAQNNDWRVYSADSIESHIFHKVDVDSLGLVTFTPFSAFLPVELTSFTASLSGGNAVLNWATATEINNKQFEIERRLEKTGWVKIATVKGKGTSAEKTNYSFTDKNPQPGRYFYRLKQVDFNGTSTYSNEVELTVPNHKVSFVLEQNYPNPFNPSTTIRFSIPEKNNVTVKVFNVIGQEVKTLFNGYLEAGSHTINFNAAGLPSGLYFYRIEAGNYTQTMKMMLMK